MTSLGTDTDTDIEYTVADMAMVVVTTTEKIILYDNKRNFWHESKSISCLE